MIRPPEHGSERHGRRTIAAPAPKASRLPFRTLASGADLTDFVVTHAYDAARRALADRDHFELDASALEA